MSSSLKLVTLALLSVNVSCLPGPDPGAYYFSKTVWTTDKDAPSHNLKIGDIEKSFGNTITLVGGESNREGNVLLNGKHICDDYWDDKDAKVVCRMLGFSSDKAIATNESHFGRVDSRYFIMDDVRCTGAETDINDCYHNDENNCGPHEGAGVRCRVNPDDLKAELEEIKDENEELRTTLSALMTKLDGLSRDLKELQGTVDFDDTVITDLISSSDDFSKHISSFNNSLTSLATSVNDHETKLGSHHDQIHSVIVKTASNSKNIEGISTVVDGHKTKVDNVTQDVLSLKASDQQQDNIIESLSTSGKWCAYKYGPWTTTDTITYDSLTLSDTNMDLTGTPLDINTGIFTVPLSGAWTLTYSLQSVVDSGEKNLAGLVLNGGLLGPETQHQTYSESGEVISTSGRSVTLEAFSGDAIYLKPTRMDGQYWQIYYCAEYINSTTTTTETGAPTTEAPTTEAPITIIQRRGDYGEPRENFNRSWTDYKQGFGEMNKEFWLGNDQIYKLTKAGDMKLRVELEAHDGRTAWAEYDTFRVEGEDQGYKLHIGGYTGTAGDSMWYSPDPNNGMKFTTRDRDNDKSTIRNCAQAFNAGWWFSTCGYSHLNGVYYTDPEGAPGNWQGITWHHWLGNKYSLKSTTMMISKKT